MFACSVIAHHWDGEDIQMVPESKAPFFLQSQYHASWWQNKNIVHQQPWHWPSLNIAVFMFLNADQRKFQRASFTSLHVILILCTDTDFFFIISYLTCSDQSCQLFLISSDENNATKGFLVFLFIKWLNATSTSTYHHRAHGVFYMKVDNWVWSRYSAHFHISITVICCLSHITPLDTI